MRKKILYGILLCILTIGIVGCGEVSYSEGMERVRKFSPWYLSSNIKAGEIYDKVLRNTN